MEIFRLEKLSFTYPGCPVPALRQIDLSINEGGFYVIAGRTGCGKSTLLRALKKELTPAGERTGRIFCFGAPIEDLTPRESARRIGFVSQDPDAQIVTDRVRSELIFALENLGLPEETIRRRMAEFSCYFGLDGLLARDVHTLSGGQKQLLNLAAVMIADPDVLLLDEPTSQLDPIAASSFLSTVKKLSDDFGVTVLITEHRLEELIPACDHLIVLEEGRVAAQGEVRTVIASLRRDSALLPYMPLPVRLSLRAGWDPPALTLREGRAYLREVFPQKAQDGAPEKKGEKKAKAPDGGEALRFHRVFCRYEKNDRDVLQGLDLTLYPSEILCLLGANGSGKSTVLRCASGLMRPYAGSVRVFGRKINEYKGRELYTNNLALMPQDAQTLFLRPTVREELRDAGIDDPSALPFDLTPLLSKHPYDLSGGEQQLLALMKVLSSRPRLLLLDEPTKGLDPEKKETLKIVLRTLKTQGAAILIVTHDIEFAAACADRAALLFEGRAASEGPTEVFFADNRFYTTAAARLCRGLASSEDVLARLT